MPTTAPPLPGHREIRFVATDLFSAHPNRRDTAFDLDLDAARSGKAGNGDPWPYRTCSN